MIHEDIGVLNQTLTKRTPLPAKAGGFLVASSLKGTSNRSKATEFDSNLRLTDGENRKWPDWSTVSCHPAEPRNLYQNSIPSTPPIATKKTNSDMASVREPSRHR